MTRDRAALGSFLRSRRDALSPARAGIAPFPGPRRVPGLRREELAVLAGLSADYYGRLEQGRQERVSIEILDSLARALRLDEVEHAHLLDLADAAPRRRPPRSTTAQRPDPGLLRLMTALDHVPVLLLGDRAEVLARNALLDAVLGRRLLAGRSFVAYLFDDPLARERISNWPVFAAAAVAGLRRELGRQPDDTRLVAAIEDLRSRHPEADRWWLDHAVQDHASVRKLIHHPAVGDLSFAIEGVTAPQDPGQRLVVYTCEPDSTTAQMLPLLRSWDSSIDPVGHRA